MAKKDSVKNIEPDEYGRILKSLNLERVRIEKGEFKVRDELMTNQMFTEVRDKYSYTNTDSGLIIKISYSLSGKNEEKETALNVKGSFILEYTTTETIKDDFFEVFSDLSLPFIAWPFFREYVYSVTSRMYIPPLTLPQIQQ